MTPDSIFAGPILRRVQSNSVVVWLATFEPLSLIFSVRLHKTTEWLGHCNSPLRVQLFQSLFCYLAEIVPQSGRFPLSRLLEYSIGELTDEVADYSSFEQLVKTDGLAYGDFPLPTFFIQAPNTKLNLLYGSCRKIHDVGGGAFDALSFGDDLISKEPGQIQTRAAALLLGGDQIYADDVHPQILDQIDTLTLRISGDYVESLPTVVTRPPGKGSRQALIKGAAKFTSDAAANHLLTLADYASMYGLVWNKRNWTGIWPPEAKLFVDALPKVRRLLANVPTYMIFDDHDVTDDWNLCIEWTRAVNGALLGRRIVGNALAAYWVFQAWGNDPIVFENAFADIADAIEGRSKDYSRLESAFWQWKTWEFFAPTYPPVYFIDTRTARGARDGPLAKNIGAPAFLKTVESWVVTRNRIRSMMARFPENTPIILVTPGPVFNFSLVEYLQGLASKAIGPYYLDYEAWGANETHLYWFFQAFAGRNVIILSGDVHYSFTSTASVVTFDNELLRSAARQYPGLFTRTFDQGPSPTYKPVAMSCFLQVNSSALKNYANDFVVGIPAASTGSRQMLIDSNGLTRAEYRDGTFMMADEHGILKPVSEQTVKPRFMIRQHVNDGFNTRYVRQHNIGWLSVDNDDIIHCLYTPAGKQFEMRWSFSNPAYWG
jgi:hypothetical protein